MPIFDKDITIFQKNAVKTEFPHSFCTRGAASAGAASATTPGLLNFKCCNSSYMLPIHMKLCRLVAY